MSIDLKDKKRDAATPIDNDTNNSIRNDSELSPLPQKLVRVASKNENEIIESKEEESSRKAKPDSKRRSLKLEHTTEDSVRKSKNANDLNA